MHNCWTCWYYTVDYDCHDKPVFSCNITSEIIEEKKTDCKDYRPENSKRYTENMLSKISENISLLESYFTPDSEEYLLLTNTMKRLKGLRKYSGIDFEV